MRRSALLILCLFGITLSAQAQDSSQPSNAASIAGIVVKEPGTQPLKKVMVQLIGDNQREGGNYAATTDQDGHFRMENVQPGRYRLYLEKTGFVEVNGRGRKSEGDVLSIQPRQSIDDLLLRMLPTAVITGRVVDEDGEPMSSVNVVVQRKKPGKTKREVVGAEHCNDLGEYRLSGLFPGQYWIVATPEPDFRDYAHLDKKSEEGDALPDTRYLPTYYPGTHDGTQAMAITLRAGDETPVNFNLVPARTYRIRGIVTGVSASQKPFIELVSKAGDGMLRANDIEPNGQFEVRGVAPGSYVARVSTSDAQTLTATQEVNVVAADVDGLKLVPMRPFTLSGHLRFEGSPVADVTQYTVNLRPANAADDPGFFITPEGMGANAPVDRAGNFQLKDVNPGAYIVQLYGGDGRDVYLKSVTLGDRSADFGFTVNGPAALDLVASMKPAMVEGDVLNHDQPVTNATVVAVPEEKYRKIPNRFRQGSTDQHGHFIIRGLAPGSYTVFAWQDVEHGEYYDADFLKSQEANGTALKVEEGSRQKIELRLSPVSDEWQ